MLNVSHLENDIRTRYEPVSRLPSLSLQHRRFAARSLAQSAPGYLLTCAAYSTPISPGVLNMQRRVEAVMKEAVHPSLSQVTDGHLASGFHWLVTELPASPVLLDCLRQQSLRRFDQIRWVLASLTEALQQAVLRGWPRFTLEPHQIHVDFALGEVRLLIPDLPLFGAGVTEEEDHLMTRDGSLSGQTSQLEPIPDQDRDYVKPLAALCCQLLGESVSAAGQNERFRALSALSAEQNHLLRSALAGGRRHGFESLGDFVQALSGGKSATVSGATSTSGTQGRSPTTASTATQPLSTPVTARQTPPPTGQGKSESAVPVKLAVPERIVGSLGPGALRLRLTPTDPGQSVLGIVGAERLTIGRATGRDFVTQFRPRNPVNDSRTLAISRLHCEALLDEGQILLRDVGTGNASRQNGSPLGSGVRLEPPFSVLVAGEYAMDFTALPSGYVEASPEVAGWPEEMQPAVRSGACLLRPQTPQALPMEVAWVFTDTALVRQPSGKVGFGDASGPNVLARLHLRAGQLWIECVQREKIILGQDPLHPGDVVPLQSGIPLLLGICAFAVEACESEG
jgi:hypothetical protein